MEEIGLAVMLASKKLVGVTPEVNLRQHVTHILLPSTNKAGHSGFETQRCHQRSKAGYQWPHKKDLCPPNLKKKKIFAIIEQSVKWNSCHLGS